MATATGREKWSVSKYIKKKNRIVFYLPGSLIQVFMDSFLHKS